MILERFKGSRCRNHDNLLLVRDALKASDDGGSPIRFHFVVGQKVYAGMLMVKPLDLW
jgi:hypothetical protein